MAAADRILAIDTMYNALAARANQYMAHQQAQPRGNAYGLSDDEIEVAKNSHSAGSVEDRIRDYAANKQKLAWMRQTGAYDDSQGKVFKR
jgi:hypothetical protein